MVSHSLPPELLLDILVRLPVKYLLRARCVCKSWMFLIRSPAFVYAFNNRALVHSESKNPLLLYRYYSEDDGADHYGLCYENRLFFAEFSEIKFPFRSANKFFRIVGYCNGLMCLTDDIPSFTDTVIIWNPSIRKSVTLPGSPSIEMRSGEVFNYVVGFGIDGINDEFKVVRIIYLLERGLQNSITKVEIYSLRSGHWREISVPFPYYILKDFWSEAFVKGAVHWIAEENPSKEGHDQKLVLTRFEVGHNHKLVLSFDMAEETFREVELPDCLASEYFLNLHVGVIRESLSLFQYQYPWSKSCCIWIMDNYGVKESWFKLVQFDLSALLLRPVGLRKNGEVLGEGWNERMIIYDPMSQLVKNVEINGTTAADISFYIANYVESLTLLDGETRDHNRQEI
ncbi:hypothetical protein NMG60_11008816 [Bertholletia excelsa]